MRTISLTQGKITIVDDDVYEWASKVKWQAHCGGRSGIWYAVRTIRENNKRRQEHLHRRIVGTEGTRKTDHIDGDGLNNLRSNLRICSTSENNHNRRLNRDNTSGYKGVSLDRKTKKYRAQIMIGKVVSLGYFSSKLDAAMAYNVAALQHFGEFARVNDI